MGVFLDSSTGTALDATRDSVTADTAAPSIGSSSIRFSGAAGSGTSPFGLIFGIASRPTFAFPGDLTFEGYFKLDAGATGDRAVFATITGGWFVWRKGSTGKLTLTIGGSDVITGSASVAEDVLYKWSVTRVGSTVTLRLNGVSQGTATNSTSLAANGVFLGSNGGNGQTFAGLMDEVRLTRAARYTADYTPTFAAFPDLASDPLAESLSLLIRGDLAAHTSAVLTPSPFKVAGTPMPFPLTWKQSQSPVKVRDVYYGGTGRVSGTVKLDGTPTDIPLRRRVWLMRERDAIVIRETWSDAATGAYTFDNIDATLKYTVITYDYEHDKRAVIADNITPDPMP